MRFNKPTLQNLVDSLNVSQQEIKTVSPSRDMKQAILQIYNNIYSMKSESAYYDAVVNINSFNKLKEEISELEAGIQSLIEAQKELQEVITVDSIKKDLDYLIKTFDQVKIRKVKYSKAISIYVKTKPISITHGGRTAEFGEFGVSVLFGASLADSAVKIKVKSFKSKDKTPHPHVSNKQICLGDFRTAFNSCVNKNLIAEAFDIILGVLRTYNPASPYRRFETFVNIICPSCKREHQTYLYNCTYCQDELCSHCLISSYPKYICTKCAGYCKKCSNLYIFGKRNTKEYCMSCAEDLKLLPPTENTETPVAEAEILENKTTESVLTTNGTGQTTFIPVPLLYNPNNVGFSSGVAIYLDDSNNEPDIDEDEDEEESDEYDIDDLERTYCSMCMEGFTEELQEYDDGLKYCKHCLYKKIVAEGIE